MTIHDPAAPREFWQRLCQPVCEEDADRVGDVVVPKAAVLGSTPSPAKYSSSTTEACQIASAAASSFTLFPRKCPPRTRCPRQSRLGLPLVPECAIEVLRESFLEFQQ